MEKVVYFLGAGFSAPLGLPLTANFLEKSKDQYFADPQRFAHFTTVLDRIREMATAGSYYATNLFNIEDLLSIYEMRDALGDGSEKKAFLQYVRDVVSYHTPPIGEPGLGQRWWANLFGDDPWGMYGAFIAVLLGHSFQKVGMPSPESTSYKATGPRHQAARYAAVSMNYDRVLENMAHFINNRGGPDLGFCRRLLPGGENPQGAYLAKLHGSIEQDSAIIPPTWNKGLGDAQILEAWRLAYRLLSDANHIRILGYSLPVTDSYVRYLLRSAAIAAPHLKAVDVICLDPDGSVKQRYDEFVVFPKYRFKPGDVWTYLNGHRNQFGNWPEQFTTDKLETFHQAFMSG